MMQTRLKPVWSRYARYNGREKKRRNTEGLGSWVILCTMVGGLERMVVAGCKRKSQGTHEGLYTRALNLITTGSVLMGAELT